MGRVFIVTAVILTLLAFRVYSIDESNISAQSAVLMVEQTGEVIFAKNEHEQRGIASTTKIMTALLTLEASTPDRQITVTDKMACVEGTSMGLLPGDKVSYHDLVYGMLLASGNDAANAAAISIAGSINDFAVMMNDKAAALGMNNTCFVTPSGLDSDNHYSTAYDMALLGCVAIRNPDFLSACSTQRAELCYGNEPYKRYMNNHNKLLQSFSGAIGIKTGFTKKSGRCLVSAAQRNGATLVCVTLNAPDDWQDHKKLLEYGFDLVKSRPVCSALSDIVVFGSDVQSVKIGLANNFSVYCTSGYSFVLKQKIKPYLIAPVKKGDIVGELQVMRNDEVVDSVALVSLQDAACTTEEIIDKKNIFEIISEKFKAIFIKNERQ